MRFYLRAPQGRGGEMVEVGEGIVSLESILSDRKDVVMLPVQLHSRSEYVGSLTVSVYALSAMQRAQAEGTGGAATGLLALSSEVDLR